MASNLKQAALDYHEFPSPGKIRIELSKPADTATDLALAYSPGVAEPVRAISAHPEDVYRFTGKGNLVAVISNGSAILGLGDLGHIASKPVMEGKALLFKRFANIDSIDIEVNANTPNSFIETVARIADTFGGINLEDIKAPDCFEIEQKLIELCDIPIFHDDQHGTAIVTAAGLLNALEIQDKRLCDAKVICLGAGAAATACMNLLIDLGADRNKLYMIDRQGVVRSDRENLDPHKLRFANDSGPRTLQEAIQDADVFLGLSGANLLTPEALLAMAPKPILFACSNPDPEINPELAKSLRNDLIIATGRSDYPNQVNNVLGFPFIFRGALDVRAKHINHSMKVAAVDALRQLAKAPVPPEVLQAYQLNHLAFGHDYILPKPTDDRLLHVISAAVAKAAVDSGVARLPYPNHYPI